MAPKIVVLGASQGGLDALRVVLGGLPEDFPVPVAIVQHRDKTSGNALCEMLQHACALPVREVQDKEPIIPGHVYLAPADYHLLVDLDGFSLSTDGLVCHARPSINVLFESAADALRGAVVGVVLTGAGEDGRLGASRIKERGGMMLVQDPATAEKPDMPTAAISSADKILPLSGIAPSLTSLCQASQAGREPA